MGVARHLDSRTRRAVRRVYLKRPTLAQAHRDPTLEEGGAQEALPFPKDLQQWMVAGEGEAFSSVLYPQVSYALCYALSSTVMKLIGFQTSRQGNT